MLMQSLARLEPGMCIFKSRIGENQHIGRTRAFNIIKRRLMNYISKEVSAATPCERPLATRHGKWEYRQH